MSQTYTVAVICCYSFGTFSELQWPISEAPLTKGKCMATFKSIKVFKIIDKETIEGLFC